MGILRRTKRTEDKPVKAEEETRHPIAEWAVTILLLLFGTTNVLQAFVVPTGSMENTVLVGDHLLVDKLAYAPSDPVSARLLPYREVKRGDVICFRYPLDIKQTYVKRVIGVPGDRIRFRDKELILNGHAVREPYKVLVPYAQSSYLNNFPGQPDIRIFPRGVSMLAEYVKDGELVVPSGQYLALGDNRDNSEDSRFWGLVPRENIIGKPAWVYWSYDAPTERLVDNNVRIDHLVDIATHFFSKTRWDRTFRTVRAYELR